MNDDTGRNNIVAPDNMAHQIECLPIKATPTMIWDLIKQKGLNYQQVREILENGDNDIEKAYLKLKEWPG
ncbi:MAG: hypothetical protein ABSA51_07515 [Anaerolineaceae bacterium]|jgi:hypothetical protein